MTTETEKTNLPATVQPTPGALVQAAGLSDLIQGHEQEGLEDMKQEDRATPFIGIVQSMSPQRDRNHQKFIDGAVEGDAYNTVTNELFKFNTGVRVVPVYFTKVWNQWVPRDIGGGFLGSYADAELSKPIFVPARGAEYQGPTQTVETANHFVLVESADGTWAPALISMTSTKLAASRKWNTLMTGNAAKYKAPIYARIYVLKTVQQKNDKGTFYNWKVEDVGFVTPELFQLASEFRTILKAGLVTVDYTKSDKESAETETETTPDDGKY